MPTVLSLVGIDSPTEQILDGKDLSGVIAGEVGNRNAPIGFESQFQLAWIDDRYKLVFVPEQTLEIRQKSRGGPNPATSFEFELYDIVDDPGETTDLATERPELVSKMSTELAEWRESVALSTAATKLKTDKYAQQRADLADLGRLTTVPKMYDAEGGKRDGGCRRA